MFLCVCIMENKIPIIIFHYVFYGTLSFCLVTRRLKEMSRLGKNNSFEEKGFTTHKTVRRKWESPGPGKLTAHEDWLNYSHFEDSEKNT
jgi:hypothetical protein